jgi:flagellar FliJ protein
MRRFRFRLERLLEIRAYREREWQAKLAQAMGTCIRLANQIKDNTEAVGRSFFQDWKKKDSKELDLELLRYREHYQRRLIVENQRFEIELEQSIKIRDEVQQKYLEVSKQRKVLDKLKERKQVQYYAQAKREEFEQQNEISLGQKARKAIT